MLNLPQSVKIYLATEPTDMRKGPDGLSAMVRSKKLDPFSGDLFAFISRRRDRVKILTWSVGGFVLYYKRLEKGRFKRPTMTPGQCTVLLDSTQLNMLLDGIDLSRVRRPKLWKPPASTAIFP